MDMFTVLPGICIKYMWRVSDFGLPQASKFLVVYGHSPSTGPSFAFIQQVFRQIRGVYTSADHHLQVESDMY